MEWFAKGVSELSLSPVSNFLSADFSLLSLLVQTFHPAVQCRRLGVGVQLFQYDVCILFRYLLQYRSHSSAEEVAAFAAAAAPARPPPPHPPAAPGESKVVYEEMDGRRSPVYIGVIAYGGILRGGKFGRKIQRPVAHATVYGG